MSNAQEGPQQQQQEEAHAEHEQLQELLKKAVGYLCEQG